MEEQTTIIKQERETEILDELSSEMKESAEADIDIELLKEMMKAGLMFGHKKTKTDPKFKPYIFITRNGIEIIDLAKTISSIDKAAYFLKNCVKDKKIVLLAALQPAAREAMGNLAEKFNFSFVKNRWIGGLITNFKTISQRIDFFRKMKADMESGRFDKYTKKERVVINKDIEKMKKNFEGIENLASQPDVVFIIDPSLKGHATALREAKRRNIPVVAIVDSDDNPEKVDYPIYANDHAKASIEWIIKKIEEKLS